MGANAQTSVPAFTAGQVLTAAQMTQVNTGMPVFASSTERDDAFDGTGEKTLAEGQTCYLEDTDVAQVYDGATWQPLAFGGDYIDYSGSITFTNITLGNGTVNYARYATLGNMVHYYGKITFGSTTSVTGNVEISTPFSAANEQPGAGNVQLTEDGIASYVGFGRSNSNYFSLFATLETGSRVKWANVNATVPFTWGNLDRIAWTLVYEKA